MTGPILEGLGFPEALRWHEGALWFSDMFRSRVLRWTPEKSSGPNGLSGTVTTVLNRERGGPTVPGGLGWLPSSSNGIADMLVVDCVQRQLLRLHGETSSITVHADLRAFLTHSGNDMHVDADGTAWVGGYGFNPDRDLPAASPLVRIDPDGTVTRTRSTFVFPNGCERDVDGSLLVAETFADRVSRVSQETGLTLRAQLPPGSGPDGISIAPDGTVYVALAFAGELVALPPAGAADDPPRLIYRPELISEGPSATPLGVYDCAVHPDGRRIAIAIASTDESLAERVDTGRIVILDLTSFAGAQPAGVHQGKECDGLPFPR